MGPGMELALPESRAVLGCGQRAGEERRELQAEGLIAREGLQAGPGGGACPARMVGGDRIHVSGSATPLEGGVSLPGPGVLS